MTPSYDPPKPSPQEIALQQEQLALMREQREYMAKQQLIQEQERARLQLETAETAADAARMGSQANRYGEQGPFRMVSMPYGGFLVNGQNRAEGSGVRRDDPGPTGFNDPAPEDSDAGDDGKLAADNARRAARLLDIGGYRTPEQEKRIASFVEKNPKFADYLIKYLGTFGSGQTRSQLNAGNERWSQRDAWAQ